MATRVRGNNVEEINAALAHLESLVERVRRPYDSGVFTPQRLGLPQEKADPVTGEFVRDGNKLKMWTGSKWLTWSADE